MKKARMFAFILLTVAGLSSANYAAMCSAQMCVNGDDWTDIYINGNSVGTFDYVNHDSTSPISCKSVPIAYINEGYGGPARQDRFLS